jgi:hypothetical protein
VYSSSLLGSGFLALRMEKNFLTLAGFIDL